MTKAIIFDDLARTEYREACDYLEAARETFGDLFESEVEGRLKTIAAQPRMHAADSRGVRKSVIQRFRYCIYYQERSDHIRIISVFHTSRDPREWQKRV